MPRWCVGARLGVLFVPGWLECGGAMVYGTVLGKGKYG